MKKPTLVLFPVFIYFVKNLLGNIVQVHPDSSVGIKSLRISKILRYLYKQLTEFVRILSFFFQEPFEFPPFLLILFNEIRFAHTLRLPCKNSNILMQMPAANKEHENN